MYGFQEHLSAKFPSQMVVDVTQVCNNVCFHCPHVEFEKSSMYQALHLDKKLNEKLIDEVCENDECKYVRYTGNGEPLLHPDIIEILAYGTKITGKINLTTNGRQLTEEMIKELLAIEVDVIDISINAFSESTYELITSNPLEPVRSNVHALLRLSRNKPTKVFVSFVEHELNRHETKRFKQYWEAAGVDKALVRKFHSSAGLLNNGGKKISERKPCLYPFERLGISPDGWIHYCPEDWYGESKLADFRHNTIKEIWQGEGMNKLRQAHLENKLNYWQFCKNCTDWQFTKFPVEGRSYSNLMSRI